MLTSWRNPDFPSSVPLSVHTLSFPRLELPSTATPPSVNKWPEGGDSRKVSLSAGIPSFLQVAAWVWAGTQSWPRRLEKSCQDTSGIIQPRGVRSGTKSTNVETFTAGKRYDPGYRVTLSLTACPAPQHHDSGSSCSSLHRRTLACPHLRTHRSLSLGCLLFLSSPWKRLQYPLRSKPNCPANSADSLTPPERMDYSLFLYRQKSARCLHSLTRSGLWDDQMGLCLAHWTANAGRQGLVRFCSPLHRRAHERLAELNQMC